MTPKMKLLIGAAGLVILIAAAAVAYNKLSGVVRSNEGIAANAPAANAVRQRAPDFSMLDQDENSVSLSGIIANGKPIVLNFWASWCPPCKVEMPEFDRVYREIGNEVQFMMVDLADGQRETVEKGKQYVREKGFAFPVYFDTGQEGAYIYGIRAIPSTLFIDGDGYIVTGVQGAIDEQTLRRGIELIWNR